MDRLPETGFVRLPNIVGRAEVTKEEAARNQHDAQQARLAGKKPNTKPKRPRKAITGVIPVCRSAWLKGVRVGKYPKPIKLAAHTTAWRVEDIRALIEAQCRVPSDQLIDVPRRHQLPR
jgi:pyrrolidone-carboxylate peptidase